MRVTRPSRPVLALLAGCVLVGGCAPPDGSGAPEELAFIEPTASPAGPGGSAAARRWPPPEATSSVQDARPSTIELLSTDPLTEPVLPSRGVDAELASATAESEGVDGPTCADPVGPSAGGYAAAFGRAIDGWLKGDLTDTIVLPDGRTVWIFGDTYYGELSDGDALAPGWTFARSSAIVERGGCFEAVEPAEGHSWIPNLVGNVVNWPAEALVIGDQLAVFTVEIVHDPDHGPPGLDFRTVGGAIAVFELDELGHPHTLTRGLPHIGGHPFSQGLHTHAGHVYAYATDVGAGTFAARFPADDGIPAIDDWEFWDGIDWQPAVDAAVPIADDRIRVELRGGTWRGLSLPILETAVLEYEGASPVGPFVPVREHDLPANPAPRVNRWTYEAQWIHSARAVTDVLAFNTLPADPLLVLDDIHLYGPTFMELPGS